MKIINFGSCNIDYVYALDHIVAPGETEASNNLEVYSGGKGLNQSIALAKAGGNVYHAGCIGEDGDMLIGVLKQNQVNTKFLQRVKGKNGHAIIQVSQEGENSIFLYPGSNAMITEEYIDSVLDKFSAGDILLLQNEINNLKYIVEKAYQKGLQIIFNPSPYNKIIEEIDLQMISYLILNEVEGKDISKCENTEKILTYFREKYPQLKLMLTLGKRGCVYQDKSIRVFHPIFEAKAVDTTAAGDTFTGYFIAGIATGTEMGQILKMASCASAIAVSRPGAAPSIPTKDEVLIMMETMKIRDNVTSL
ncbi:MAG: ribokinase [Clostridia bacterium]|nr:ribokinase [Clostridia bacterium]